MSSTLRRPLAVLFVVVLVLAAVPTASAQEARTGGTITVPAGTVHEGNLVVLGGTVIIEGTVDGNVQGVAGSVTVSGTVTGDIQAAAGSVTIDGVVAGSVDSGTGSLTIAEGARVDGSIETGAGSLAIYGTVSGNVEAGVNSLTVGESAVIGGNLRYDAATLDIADGATIGGTIERVEGLSISTGIPFASGLDWAVEFVFVGFGFLVNLALGAVLLLAAPRFSSRVTATGTGRAIQSGLTGLLAFVGVPVAMVLISITIVGIPIAIAGLLVYLVLLWAAVVYGALVTGDWLLGYANVDSRWLALVVGLLIAGVASVLPFGGLVVLAYLFLGLGALALSLWEIRRRTGGGAEPLPEDDEGDTSVSV